MSRVGLSVLLFALSIATGLGASVASLDRLSVLRGAVEPGFAIADTPRQFVFPQDHGPHPDFRHEWWYLTDSCARRMARYSASK